MTDPVLDRLRTLAPDPAAVAATWPTDQRANTLAHITAPRRRWRAVAVAGTVAAAAAAVTVAPVLAPAGRPGGAPSAAAAELTRLARVAAAAPAEPTGHGPILHVVSTTAGTVQEGARGVVPARSRDETWIDRSGRSWSRGRVESAADPTLDSTDVREFPPGFRDAADPSPAYLAALPTDPGRLRAYLRGGKVRHESGAARDQAAYDGVRGILLAGFAPPALRSAALRVLAGLGSVRLDRDARDPIGRAAVRVNIGHRQELFIDPRTGQGAAERSAANTEVVHTLEQVPAVPAEVLRAAKLQHN